MGHKLYRINKFDRNNTNNYRYYETRSGAHKALRQLERYYKDLVIEEAEITWKQSS